ncbi:polysaccharide pyruvyl transferase family protein [Kinneretia asaccharophila]|uniref:Succinoglycan biosynthesis protein ExoV n=1 Tax=Roseateles asaccharophilus TaxID=582607 RepID=A0A4R6MVS8_9BURK|nr:polysaccharide pyruvyl transferase family protein [Roseateles asaccharophilus]MDN3546005.1 polysaccharide pyruvyl transferase family protein [Roseateles asaccharophilus]TDP06545.1 succinoglycan biosynthesis protein ExoV [Roseateles asaccharophilus]
MKLHYFKDPAGNFGDDLNPWLWGRLIPDVLDDDPSERFVGIGTLLNHRLPDSGRLHIMGSGAGYGRPMQIDQRVRVHAVRGHLTAKSLGLAVETAVADAAVLIRQVELPPLTLSRQRVGVMFTGQSLAAFDWMTLSQQIGLHPISCHWSVDRVLDEIRRCDVLLSEAMHGAIIADALRVPWVPITCNPDILGAKWQDWLSVFDLPYQPSAIRALHAPQSDAGWRAGLKRVASAVGLGAASTGPRPSAESDIGLARAQLLEAARRPGTLSSEAVMNAKVRRFVELLDVLRAERLAR